MLIIRIEFFGICLLMAFSVLISIPTCYTQCNTTIPDNSIVILDSNTYHTDTNGMIQPEDIPGWTETSYIDGIVYPVMAGGVSINDTLQWRSPPILSTGACGPEYIACFQTNLVPFASVNTEGEMNWLVSSYYETEANAIHIRVTCTATSIYEQDCRKTFRIFYYESDTSVAVTESLLSQFLPADSYTDQLTDEHVVLAAFTKSKNGFYIGFLNSIPCAVITEILFYYFQCPAAYSVSGVYSVSAVLSPSPTDVSVSTNISCAPTLLPRDPLSLPAVCYWNGTWRLPQESVCECMTGSYLSADSGNISCVPCPANSYRDITDAMQTCIQCPSMSNTRGAEGAAECQCETAWFRGEGESAREPCGQSPSAVRNVRVERGTSPAALSAVWDVPAYLGSRDASDLRYMVRYHRTVSPWIEYGVELTERELVLNVSESTEYIIVVTSLNSVSSVSDVYNRANLTVLSSFPVISSISYNETSQFFAWIYSLYAEREYVFELSYTSLESNETASVQLSSSECECTEYTCVCSVYARDFNTQFSINFRLYYEESGALIYTNLRYTDTSLVPTPCVESNVFTILLVLTGVSCTLFVVPLIITGIVFLLYSFVKKFRS